MAARIIVPILCLICVLTQLPQCSSRLLTRSDYAASTDHLKNNRIDDALRTLPKGEEGTFITIMERTYLNLLRGNPDIDELARYAKKIDNRVRYRVSREIQNFFYVETPEGYYASEHEVIWMHMLLSWGNILRRDMDRASVEAKIASTLLGQHWSDEGRFDDPLLRIILAGLWTMQGRWEEAQVDFRVAAMLDPSLRWCRELSRMNRPPADLVIILGGAGPRPVWQPRASVNPFRGFRGISFAGRGMKSSLELKDAAGTRIGMHLSPDSSCWYRRHFIRDNEIHDLVQDSQYGARMTMAFTKGTIGTATGIAVGTVIVAGSLGLGGAIVALGLYGGSGEVAAGGILVGISGSVYGVKTGKRIARNSLHAARRDLDVSGQYRFVRFLPEYAWAGWSRRELKLPFTASIKKQDVMNLSKEQGTLTKVNILSLGFYPDCRSYWK